VRNTSLSYFWSYYFLFYWGESKYIASFFQSYGFFLHTSCGTVILWAASTDGLRHPQSNTGGKLILSFWQGGSYISGHSVTLNLTSAFI